MGQGYGTETVQSAKYLVRDMGAALLYAAGITRPRRLPKDRLTIVTFHRFLPQEYRDAYPHRGISVTPEMFGAFLDFFGQHFDCRTVSKAVAAWREGRRGHKPLLAITVDDGVEDNYTYGRPELARAGIPATFYVTVRAVEEDQHLWHDVIGFYTHHLASRPGPMPAALRELGVPWTSDRLPPDAPLRLVDVAKRMPAAARTALIEQLRQLAGDPPLPGWSGMMSWNQVRALAAEGHEIGSHTMSHAILLRQCQPDLDYELAGSRARLEDILGRPVRSFAFPNGDFDDQSLAAVPRAGYETAVTTRIGTNAPDASLFELRRFNIEQERNQRRRGGLSRALLSWRLSRAQVDTNQVDSKCGSAT